MEESCLMELRQNNIPIFGSIDASIEYQPRQAAYCVVKDLQGRVAVVLSKSGYYFLPGGGSVLNETPEQTVAREVREELAREVRIMYRIGEVTQYFRAEGKDYRMKAIFFAAELGAEIMGVGEYELYWIEPEILEIRFFHQCHAWAVSQSESSVSGNSENF